MIWQLFDKYFCFRFGGSEGATFCALTTLCKELETFNAIDVYQVAKLYHNKRPGIWKSAVSSKFFTICPQKCVVHIRNPKSVVHSTLDVGIFHRKDSN